MSNDIWHQSDEEELYFENYSKRKDSKYIMSGTSGVNTAERMKPKCTDKEANGSS